jgi:hypothetical protein
MSEWETFCDESYFHLWRVRRKDERGFDEGVHVNNGEEAKTLVELLNRLERERDEAREENKKFCEALEWISKRYDDSKPIDQVAMDAYEMSCTASSVLQKEVK